MTSDHRSEWRNALEVEVVMNGLLAGIVLAGLMWSPVSQAATAL
jgi:hypothetical protein